MDLIEYGPHVGKGVVRRELFPELVTNGRFMAIFPHHTQNAFEKFFARFDMDWYKFRREAEEDNVRPGLSPVFATRDYYEYYWMEHFFIPATHSPEYLRRAQQVEK